MDRSDKRLLFQALGTAFAVVGVVGVFALPCIYLRCLFMPFGDDVSMSGPVKVIWFVCCLGLILVGYRLSRIGLFPDARDSCIFDSPLPNEEEQIEHEAAQDVGNAP